MTQLDIWQFSAKIINDWKLLTIFTQSSIFDVWLGSENNRSGVIL